MPVGMEYDEPAENEKEINTEYAPTEVFGDGSTRKRIGRLTRVVGDDCKRCKSSSDLQYQNGAFFSPAFAHRG